MGTEGAALGAALLAGFGAGIYGTLEAAVSRVYQVQEVYRPNAEAHRQYSARYQGTYRRLIQARWLVRAGRWSRHGPDLCT